MPPQRVRAGPSSVTITGVGTRHTTATTRTTATARTVSSSFGLSSVINAPTGRFERHGSWVPSWTANRPPGLLPGHGHAAGLGSSCVILSTPTHKYARNTTT